MILIFQNLFKLKLFLFQEEFLIFLQFDWILTMFIFMKLIISGFMS